MLLFGTMSGGLYVLFAFTPITYATLLVAVVLLTTSFLFVASAQNGLASMIGQQHAMSGQISVVWNIFASVPTVGALLIGGALSDLLEDSNADQAARILYPVAGPRAGGFVRAAAAAVRATEDPQLPKGLREVLSRHNAFNQPSTKVASLRARAASRNLLSAFASICRMRSRVTPKALPISSSV